jgi:polyisoprenoid-binding protein YceI
MALACGSAAAQPASYTLDPRHSFVYFEVLHFGTSTLRGRLGPTEGSVTLDREQRRGEIGVSLHTDSVSTSVPQLDEILRGPKGFNSDPSAVAWFISRDLQFKGDQLQGARGELSLRGTSTLLELTAVRFACRQDDERKREICGGDFVGELRRSDLGMTLALPFVADRVKVIVQVEAIRN